jgi:RNA ligase
MKFDIKTLEDYCNRKLLIKHSHLKYPITIWNYSAKVQYEKLWDEITLQCRCLVTDESGFVVAKTFDKFFNLEEENNIPNEPYEIYEKLDGSLISLFHYDEELIVCSKGSFISSQVKEARRIFHKYEVELDKLKTYCFELVAPWNRIVCNYSEEQLFLLAKFDSDGNEYSIDEYKNYFPLVNKYNYLEIEKIKGSIADDKEGVVVRFESGKRIKIKGKEYVRLHKIVSNLSEKLILELLVENKSIESVLENIPDELFDWAKKIQEKFIDKYNEILDNCKKDYKILETRKETALYFNAKKYPKVLFSMLDQKDIDKIIWKIVEKEFQNEK